MNSKTKLAVISTIIALLALVTITLAYAHTNRTNQYATNHNSSEEYDHHESCEEFMNQWMHTNGAPDERHGMMNEETEESSDGGHGCH